MIEKSKWSYQRKNKLIPSLDKYHLESFSGLKVYVSKSLFLLKTKWIVLLLRHRWNCDAEARGHKGTAIVYPVFFCNFKLAVRSMYVLNIAKNTINNRQYRISVKVAK